MCAWREGTKVPAPSARVVLTDADTLVHVLRVRVAFYIWVKERGNPGPESVLLSTVGWVAPSVSVTNSAL